MAGVGRTAVEHHADLLVALFVHKENPDVLFGLQPPCHQANLVQPVDELGPRLLVETKALIPMRSGHIHQLIDLLLRQDNVRIGLIQKAPGEVSNKVLRVLWNNLSLRTLSFWGS